MHEIQIAKNGLAPKDLDRNWICCVGKPPDLT